MIEYVRGQVASLNPAAVVIETPGGRTRTMQTAGRSVGSRSVDGTHDSVGAFGR